ncbi:MAG TPA: hypothetical protein VGI20_13670 [Rhizomicrobium sp.]|jgi:hypothetical protein
MTRFTIATIAITALAAGTVSAEACNPLLNKDYGKHVAPTTLPASMLASNNPNSRSGTSIVGLWHVIHTQSNGSLFFEAFDRWQGDGTETELGNLPPATGAICLGAWAQDGKHVNLLTHVDWLYDLNGNWTGTLNLTEINKVNSGGNVYSGTFDAKFYDTNGNLANEVTGMSKADRLN